MGGGRRRVQGKEGWLLSRRPLVVIFFSPLFSRRLIQYRPGVHQASVAKVLSTPPNSGSFSPTSHPPLTPLDERFAGAVVGLTVNSRGRAQCSACRIKRKTNVNYGRIALHRFVARDTLSLFSYISFSLSLFRTCTHIQRNVHI